MNADLPYLHSPEALPDWSQWPVPSPQITKIVIGKLGKTLKARALPDDFAERFPNLKLLHLWGLEGLTTLPQLPAGLEELDVRGCQDLEELRELPHGLKLLDAGECKRLQNLPPQLPLSLEEVYLHGCEKLKLAGALEPLLENLKDLQLYGCRFDDWDRSICGEEKENVAGKVRAHFAAIKNQGQAFLAECKVVVLGNGGVGKTSLVRSLKGLPFEDTKSTEGIRLWKWDGGGEPPFPDHPEIPLEVNIWDFGGQDLYHNTHRLFLESRAVFIIAWREPREDGRPFREEHPDDPIRPLSYWFDQVKAANEHAQIILVRTWCDVDHNPRDWRDEVGPEYHHLKCHEISAKDVAKGDRDEFLVKLREAIMAELKTKDAVTLGQGRKAVREKIREWQPACEDDQQPLRVSSRPVLEYRAYLSLVEETYRELGFGSEATRAESVQLLDYLHQSGAVYAPPKWRTGKFGAHPIIMDQRWAIDAIYQPFIPGSEAREEIIASDGLADSDLLDELVWEDLDKNGNRIFNREHQWIFREFMVSCGVMVTLNEPGKYILPELLPTRQKVERNEYDPLIRAVTSGGAEGRSYYLRHRSLGTGFGCLLVARLLAMFGKSPIFRYGGIGRVEVGSDDERFELRGRSMKSRQPSLKAVVVVEWYRENEDAYHGDLIITCHSEDPDRDGEVLHHLWGQLSEISGFPKEAEFELKSGKPVADLARLKLARMPKISREQDEEGDVLFSGRNLPRLFTVGLSAAGKDEGDNKNIEFWPWALKANLEGLLESDCEVIFYHSDEKRKSVSELVGDLKTSDLMIAFVGKKYLHSEYCMVEFLTAARYWQPDDTFFGENHWQHRLWVLPLQDAGYLLARTDKAKENEQKKAAQNWCAQWLDRAIDHDASMKKEFRGSAAADRIASTKYPYHEWMKLAEESEEKLGPILGAIKQARHGWADETPPQGLDEGALKQWAREKMKPFAQRVADEVKKIAGGLSSSDRGHRLRIKAIKRWQRHDYQDAADVFDYWVDTHPDAESKRQEYLEDKAMEDVELEPVRAKWRELVLENRLLKP